MMRKQIGVNLFLSFVISAFSTIAFSQATSAVNKTEDAVPTKFEKQVALIAQKNEVHNSGIGFAGTRTAVYDAYIALQKLADEIELYELLSHKSPAVRVYAFKALQQKKSDLIPAAKEKLANDTANVITFFGCMRSIATVNSFLNDEHHIY